MKASDFPDKNECFQYFFTKILKEKKIDEKMRKTQKYKKAKIEAQKIADFLFLK